MKLRSALMLLAAGSVVPLSIFAVVAIDTLVDHQRETVRRESMGRVVSAMSAVDAQLRGSIAALQALGASDNLRTGDIRAFYEEAKRVLPTQRYWRNIGLATPAREQLLDAVLPFGANAPFRDDNAFDVALGTGKPAVSDVGTGTAVTAMSVRLRVPVLIDGYVRYMLSAPLDPALFKDLLVAQSVPGDWVIALADRNRRFIARIPEAAPGDVVSDDLKAALERAPAGWFEGRTTEGRATFTPYVTSALSGWALAIAIPTATVDAVVWRTLIFAAGGLLFALACAIGLAWLLARRIASPIVRLAGSAELMGQGNAFELPPPGRLDEVGQLHRALRGASKAIREREQLAAGEKAALEREQRALRSADVAKDEFIATLSHELRNPLSALASAVQLLASRPHDDATAVQARAIIERQSKQIARLIEDLLDVSRVVAGKANLVPEVFDLAGSVRQIVETWRIGGRFRGRAVELNATPAFVYADRARTEQIFSNLLDNAIKFTKSPAAIRVSVGREEVDAVLAVSDQGQGIDHADLPRIFDLFAQGGSGAPRTGGGLGIGLAIARRLAEMQGGALDASSAGSGRGSLFVLRLPAVDPLPAAKPATGLTGPAPLARHRRSILIVDDHDDVRRSLQALLALAGHTVHEAADGVTGVAIASKAVPDVVFVDVGLPDIDGYEVARRLRALPFGDDVILIAVSGYGQMEDKRRAYEAGFDSYLTKPVALDALEQAVAAVDRRRPEVESGRVA